MRRGLSSPFAGAGGEQGQAEANQAALVATHSVRCRIAPARGGAGSSPCGWHESQPQAGALHQRCGPGRIPAADELQECVAGGKLAPGDRWFPSTKRCGHVKEEMDLAERIYISETPSLWPDHRPRSQWRAEPGSAHGLRNEIVASRQCCVSQPHQPCSISSLACSRDHGDLTSGQKEQRQQRGVLSHFAWNMSLVAQPVGSEGLASTSIRSLPGVPREG